MGPLALSPRRCKECGDKQKPKPQPWSNHEMNNRHTHLPDRSSPFPPEHRPYRIAFQPAVRSIRSEGSLLTVILDYNTIYVVNLFLKENLRYVG